MDHKINIEYINPFLIGASMVFNTLFQIDLKTGKLKRMSSPKPSHDVIIKLDITGKISGYVIYSISFHTVRKMAEILVPGISKEQLMDDYKDIVGEIGNMITGNAINILSDSDLDISTPLVMKNEEFKQANISTSSVLVVNLYSRFSQIEISIVLK